MGWTVLMKHKTKQDKTTVAQCYDQLATFVRFNYVGSALYFDYWVD